MKYENDVPQSYAESFVRNFNVLASGIHTALPGKIETYDGKRVCSVKPLVQKKLADGTYLPLPVIEEVPLVMPGSTDFGMTYPLKKGDPVLILFMERSIEEWLSNGVDAKPVDLRRFSLTDAVCIPGIFNNSFPFPESNNEDFILRYKEGIITIKEDTTIEFKNDKSAVSMDADGNISMTNEKATVTYKADGEILIDNGNGSYTIAPDGEITIQNGSGAFSVATSGEVTINSGAGDITVTASGNIEMNGNTKSFVTHTELDLALQGFITTLNTQLASIQAGAAAAIAASGLWLTPLVIGGIVLDISSSQTTTIKTGG